MLNVLKVIINAGVLVSAVIVGYIIFFSYPSTPPCPPDIRKKSNKLPNNSMKQSTHDAEIVRLKSENRIIRIQKKQTTSVFHVTEHKMAHNEFINLMLRYERRAMLLERLLEKYREEYGKPVGSVDNYSEEIDTGSDLYRYIFNDGTLDSNVER